MKPRVSFTSASKPAPVKQGSPPRKPIDQCNEASQRLLRLCHALKKTSAQAVRHAGLKCSRREYLHQLLGTALSPIALSYGSAFAVVSAPAVAGEKAAKTPSGPITSALCDAECASKLGAPITLPSGLQYWDIVPGTGAQPVAGYQVTMHYVAMTSEGRAFDDSLAKGAPYDIRYGAGAVIAGLDEGLKGMRSGGLRRLYVPGNLAFPKPLPSAAGRPRVPANSPLLFDVNLLFIPGFDDVDLVDEE